MSSAAPGNAGDPTPPPAGAPAPPGPAIPRVAPAPPPPPREVTPAASRRAWHEPRVHFWWIVALALVAGAVWLGIEQALTWNRDASLIRGGTTVDAVVWRWGARVKGRPIIDEEGAVIVYEWNGREIVQEGQRLTGRVAPTFSGDSIPIFIDPEDPMRWTARSEPPSLLNMLVGALAVLALAVLVALVGFIKRRGVIALWRHGEARPAAVVETSHTAMAPRSRLVRCALTDGSDRRLIAVYVPHRAAALQPGDGLWLIMPPGRPDKAVAAVSFGA